MEYLDEVLNYLATDRPSWYTIAINVIATFTIIATYLVSIRLTVLMLLATLPLLVVGLKKGRIRSHAKMTFTNMSVLLLLIAVMLL